ncbi:hypothetical protein [uncultured Tateyamaria sp.]|uniref:hypothetical protein n=1 Tax=Tateyamaria sp. 1078 TaxID=3417464 RepID=UPI002614562F|nr:hypothetical protein [uncultured Tateyamaria sp.]
MSHMFFLSAGALSALWLVVHVIVGGRQIARPLVSATALSPVVRHTQYLCWHFTTVAIACMAGFFLWAAHAGDATLAAAGTALATGFFLVGVALVPVVRETYSRLPQGWLFLPVALLGLTGLMQ